MFHLTQPKKKKRSEKKKILFISKWVLLQQNQPFNLHAQQVKSTFKATRVEKREIKDLTWTDKSSTTINKTYLPLPLLTPSDC